MLLIINPNALIFNNVEMVAFAELILQYTMECIKTRKDVLEYECKNHGTKEEALETRK